MAYHIATNEIIQFSPLFAYYATQQIDGLLGRDAGSTISGGMQCSKQFGSCPSRSDALSAAGPLHGPHSRRIVHRGGAVQNPLACDLPHYDDVFSFLASGQGGVEIGIDWGAGMTPERDGVIETVPAGQRRPCGLLPGLQPPGRCTGPQISLAGQ